VTRGHRHFSQLDARSRQCQRQQVDQVVRRESTIPTKAPTTRIDETLDYISGYTGLDASLVQDAAAFADGYIGRAQWTNNNVYFTKDAQNNVGSGDYRHFSNHMTMTDATTPGNKNQRAMRRAIFLLRSAMGDTQAAAHAKAILITDVQQAFDDVMVQAACSQNQQVGKTDANEYVFKRLLRDDPLGFLGRIRVIVHGAVKVDSKNNTNPVPFTFYYDGSKSRFVFHAVQGGFKHAGSFGLTVSSVPAFQWDTVPGRGTDPARGSFDTIRATELSEKCMVTTQLIGCSFCLQDAGGSLFACHLKPSTSVNGVQLAQQLTGSVPNVTRAKFSNAPPSTNPVYVFGRGHGSFPNGGGYDVRLEGGSRYATVLGLQRKGVWSLYAQEVYDDGIIGVRKIWP